MTNPIETILDRNCYKNLFDFDSFLFFLTRLIDVFVKSQTIWNIFYKNLKQIILKSNSKQTKQIRYDRFVLNRIIFGGACHNSLPISLDQTNAIVLDRIADWLLGKQRFK
ncbi:hypothetical protein SSS_04864 [Sarcoptes scabiei]|nr:hypothetical protein SSS_04864 [Sarcoptes scabiei]